MSVHVFATDVNDEATAQALITLLHSKTGQATISIDLEDVDRVLRVETDELEEVEVMAVCRIGGVRCRQLA